MTFKIIEKSILPFSFAVVIMLVFTWKFPSIYHLIIENFKEEKLSILYAHLFIYSFLLFNLLLFVSNVINTAFIRSKAFIMTIVVTTFVFYGLSHHTFLDTIYYFLEYPLPQEALLFMILFLVSTLIYALYSMLIAIFNGFVPILHSFVFFVVATSYALWFIHNYAYPLSTLSEQYSKLF
jgi:hypothetical protein